MAKAECLRHNRKAHQKKIQDAGLQDFKNWVQECATALNDAGANGHGNTRKVHNLVNQMEGKPGGPGRPGKSLTEDEPQGNMLQDSKAVAMRWFSFLTTKFSATDAETNDRPPMAELPRTVVGNTLSDEEALHAIANLSSGKACGLDGIPDELYKNVPICKQVLAKLLQRVWLDEDVSTEFAKAVFVIIYKNKGSHNDPTKYKCIGLLGHAYKALSQCLLVRINTETNGYLSDWQAGFHKKRGCRDNIMIMRTIYEDALEQGGELCATFIDYSTAFDSVRIS